MNLAQRAAVTQATWNKYRGRAFDWKGATCVHVLRSHLRAMGHKPPKMPSFQSAIGAKRALKAMGADDLADMMRGLGMLEISPADNDVIHLQKPMIEGFVIGDEIGWSISLAHHIGISFEVEEAA